MSGLERNLGSGECEEEGEKEGGPVDESEPL